MNNNSTELAEKLGYNYVYHFNPYTNKWNCMTRDVYYNYFNGVTPHEYTSGNTIEEAQALMLANIIKER